MTVEIGNLIKVSTYAKKKKITRQTVYNMIESGRLKSENIDGVVFVYKK